MSKIQVSADRLLFNRAFAITRVQGRTYVIPAWQEVPDGTTYSDIVVVNSNKSVIQPPRTHTIIGSKGDKYTVSFDTAGRGNCTCVGFGYHRTCKHVKQAMSMQNI